MDTVRYAKTIGILCIIAVISAVYSGAIAVAVMLFGALPAAVICRKKMNEEEKAAQDLLESRKADCAFRGRCFEGLDHIKENEEYTVFFCPGKIIICHDGKEEETLSAAKIKDVRIYTLEEIMETAQSGRKVSLGKLGYKMDLSAGERRPDLRKNKDVRYLVIRGEKEKDRRFCMSFYASSEYTHYNRTVSKAQETSEYVKKYKRTI